MLLSTVNNLRRKILKKKIMRRSRSSSFFDDLTVTKRINGIAPPQQWLKDNGYDGLANMILKYPDKFRNIIQDNYNPKKDKIYMRGLVALAEVNGLDGNLTGGLKGITQRGRERIEDLLRFKVVDKKYGILPPFEWIKKHCDSKFYNYIFKYWFDFYSDNFFLDVDGEYYKKINRKMTPNVPKTAYRQYINQFCIKNSEEYYDEYESGLYPIDIMSNFSDPNKTDVIKKIKSWEVFSRRDTKDYSYSLKELRILTDNYKLKTISELQKMLPNRSELSIRAKAKHLGIRKENQKIYKNKEIDIIKNNPNMTNIELAELLDTTEDSIRSKRYRLKKEQNETLKIKEIEQIKINNEEIDDVILFLNHQDFWETPNHAAPELNIHNQTTVG